MLNLCGKLSKTRGKRCRAFVTFTMQNKGLQGFSSPVTNQEELTLASTLLLLDILEQEKRIWIGSVNSSSSKLIKQQFLARLKLVFL